MVRSKAVLKMFCPAIVGLSLLGVSGPALGYGLLPGSGSGSSPDSGTTTYGTWPTLSGTGSGSGQTCTIDDQYRRLCDCQLKMDGFNQRAGVHTQNIQALLRAISEKSLRKEKVVNAKVWQIQNRNVATMAGSVSKNFALIGLDLIPVKKAVQAGQATCQGIQKVCSKHAYRQVEYGLEAMTIKEFGEVAAGQAVAHGVDKWVTLGTVKAAVVSDKTVAGFAWELIPIVPSVWRLAEDAHGHWNSADVIAALDAEIAAADADINALVAKVAAERDKRQAIKDEYAAICPPPIPQCCS